MTDKSKELLKKWELPNRSSEKMGVSARLDFSTYAKLHALKVVFPHRSVNDLINDILEKGLDDVVLELGEPQGKTVEYIEEMGREMEISPNISYRFESAFQELMLNLDKSKKNIESAEEINEKGNRK